MWTQGVITLFQVLGCVPLVSGGTFIRGTLLVSFEASAGKHRSHFDREKRKRASMTDCLILDQQMRAEKRELEFLSNTVSRITFTFLDQGTTRNA